MNRLSLSPFRSASQSSIQAAPAIGGFAVAVIATMTLAGALFLGLAAAFIPPIIVFILLAFLAFAVFAWKLPEYAALILLAGLAGIFPSQIVSHTATFIDISALVLIAGFKYLSKRDQWWPLLRPLARPFLVLLFLVAAGTVRALLYQPTAHNLVFDEVAPFLYWLLFPVIALSLDTPKRLKYFLVLVLILAVYIAVGQLVQSLFQVQIFFGGRFETAETLGREYAGVSRSVTPGSFLLLFGLLASVALYIVKARHILLVPLIALFVMGLMFTFGRTLMGTTLMVMVLMGLTLGGVRVLKLAVAGAVVAVIAVGGLSVAKPEIYYALEDRVLSVGAEIRGGDSLNYRLAENRAALAQIENSPLFGIGLGHDYREGVLQVLDDVDVGARYIHNGYLYVLLKLGMFALLAYAWFYAAALVYARRTIRQLTAPYERAMAAAVFALLLMPVVTSLTRPDWMTPASTGMYAVALGLLVAYRRHHAARLPPVSG